MKSLSLWILIEAKQAAIDFLTLFFWLALVASVPLAIALMMIAEF